MCGKSGLSTGELGNTKRPGSPQKTTAVNGHRMISMVKKNSIITSSEMKNAFQEVGLIIYKSTIKSNTEGSLQGVNHL